MKKAIYAVVALAIALTALAQAEKTMVVTMKDGSTTEFNVADIDNIAFEKAQTEDPVDPDDDTIILPELTVAPPTTGPYAVGDFYSDGVNQGVVLTVDHTGSYGTMAYMVDMPQKLAYSTVWDITDANDENDGQANMATIAAIDPEYTYYPAFRGCSLLGEGWYLPAQKELQAMRGILDKVNATLTAQGYDEIPANTTYWSSTECDQFMDAMAYTALMDFPGMFGVEKSEKWPVRAFRAFGEKPQPKFTVGQLYNQDGVNGVIYWVADDDSYARVIALNDVTSTWGTLGTAVGAKSTESGDINMKAALAADPTLASLNAFKACKDQGEKWFLPAQAELKYLVQNKADINAALSANGGAPLTSSYYWTSTEFSADAPNSAVAMLFTDGSVLGSSKSVERNVRAIAYVGTRPADATTFAVGDPYYEGDQVVGIVCQVSDDGTTGRYMALQDVMETGRINAMWDKRANNDEYVLLGASSMDDGAVNMAAARANDPDLGNLTVFRLCADLGEGWYLPAFNEMLNIAANKDVLNAALRANGGSALDNGEYWTSTEGSENALERAKSVKVSDGSDFDYRKYFYMRVRPVKQF